MRLRQWTSKKYDYLAVGSQLFFFFCQLQNLCQIKENFVFISQRHPAYNVRKRFPRIFCWWTWALTLEAICLLAAHFLVDGWSLVDIPGFGCLSFILIGNLTPQSWERSNLASTYFLHSLAEILLSVAYSYWMSLLVVCGCHVGASNFLGGQPFKVQWMVPYDVISFECRMGHPTHHLQYPSISWMSIINQFILYLPCFFLFFSPLHRGDRNDP